jgi:asparagine synthase (glutamine-hydrolysing)
MHSRSQRFVVVFNGEIYNHIELRRQLGAHPWRGHSDTETLLACIEAWGIDKTLQNATGMFAFALWDRDQLTLTLARDRVGEKPLYYGWQNDTFIFASELKAFQAHPAFNGAIDRQALGHFLRLGYIPAPASIYQGIYKLPPGHFLTLSPQLKTDAQPIPYWKLQNILGNTRQAAPPGSANDGVNQLESVLSEAVRRQQMADVPLGAFLSGGIDSSLIVALMQAQSSTPIRSFTIGFTDQEYDESPHAEAVAKHLRTDHTTLILTPDDIQGVIPNLPQIYDEPFADSSQIPTFLVARLAQQHVTVCLSGDGGDELFGGYNRYTWYRRVMQHPSWLRRLAGTAMTSLSPAQWQRLYTWLRPLLPSSFQVKIPGERAHKLARALRHDSIQSLYSDLISQWQNPEQVVRGFAAAPPYDLLWQDLESLPEPEHQMMALDALTYLPDDILCKLDRAAMAVSLETRVPFLDPAVIELAWSLPLSSKVREGQGKWILRQVLDRYVPRTIIERPKMGFSIPLDTWLRGPLREWADDLLSTDLLDRQGFLNAQPIAETWQGHLNGSVNAQHQIWNVLMFQAWLNAQRCAPR